jgi:hypothetical protein
MKWDFANYGAEGKADGGDPGGVNNNGFNNLVSNTGTSSPDLIPSKIL